MNRYCYYPILLKKATKRNATREDRLDLWYWFEMYGDRYWNGECYDIGEGRAIYPVYRVIDEETFELVDVEVR